MLKASNCLTYFTTHQWTFKSNNVVALLDEMSEHDRQEFHFDLKVGDAAGIQRIRKFGSYMNAGMSGRL